MVKKQQSFALAMRGRSRLLVRLVWTVFVSYFAQIILEWSWFCLAPSWSLIVFDLPFFEVVYVHLEKISKTQTSYLPVDSSQGFFLFFSRYLMILEY